MCTGRFLLYIMKQLREIVLLLLVSFFMGCSNDKFDIPLEDLASPDIVVVRYEVEISQHELYYLSVIYNDGLTCYDFTTSSYINTDKTKSIAKLDSTYWSYEFNAKRGAVLYIGASVSSKNGISTITPSVVDTRIYINNKLVKANSNSLYSHNEYIYGIRNQNNNFYLYTKK